MKAIQHAVRLAFIAALTVSGVLLAPRQALAWGATGHEAVCEIAYDELTPKARALVDKIMAAQTDPEFKTFHAACGWPDRRGAVQNARRSQHFINVPRDWAVIRSAQCPMAPACLLTAIPADFGVLKDPDAPIHQKLVSLMFLGHWVGDIHQPLHVSFEDDRGGNDILVEGVSGCSHNGKTALHSVWDTCIPEQIMHDMGIAKTHPLGEGRAAFGDALDKEITESERAEWKASLDPLTWANESFADARATDVGYCDMSGAVCQYSTESETYEHSAPMRTLDPAGNYEEEHAALVKARLQAAGVRLAAVLDQIADAQADNP